MNPDNPEFLAWARKYGYAPWRPTEGGEREKFARYWLAWVTGTPPECKRAYYMVRWSGLLAS